ncbi:30S ribosomal protein S4 [Candidatus Babeliales bacterium]|nr:30S ribosomal protein S4 [Candidatus Babeliales bacterium]
MSVKTTGCGQCRQAGEKLFLKGARCRTSKCAVDKRGITPGQHGKKATARKLSEYGKQLREKQKIRRTYGVGESQFRRFFGLATRQKGGTGEILLTMLERRLDNVVFRLKMASSRTQSRQMIVHGHVLVNGGVVSSPSFLVKVGDVVTLAARTVAKSEFVKNVIDKRMNIGIKVPEWLILEKKDRRGEVVRFPERSEISSSIEEHLVVELYSK